MLLIPVTMLRVLYMHILPFFLIPLRFLSPFVKWEWSTVDTYLLKLSRLVMKKCLWNCSPFAFSSPLPWSRLSGRRTRHRPSPTSSRGCWWSWRTWRRGTRTSRPLRSCCRTRRQRRQACRGSGRSSTSRLSRRRGQVRGGHFLSLFWDLWDELCFREALLGGVRVFLKSFLSGPISFLLQGIHVKGAGAKMRLLFKGELFWSAFFRPIFLGSYIWVSYFRELD